MIPGNSIRVSPGGRNTDGLRVRPLFSLAAVLAVLFGLVGEVASASADTPFRLALSANMFTDVKEEDARAAMKVWIMTAAREFGVAVDPDPHITRSFEELRNMARTGEVDGLGLTTQEYVRLSGEVHFDQLIMGVHGGTYTDEYLLLVHRDSGLERLQQLKGRRLHVLLSGRMSLAMPWLDTLLLEGGQRPATEFFGGITLKKNANHVALPVFFGKVEACLLTRASFEVMKELNPQLGNNLRILTFSPPLVASCFAFRADRKSPARLKIQEAMSRLDETPAGRQILTFLQSDGLEEQPVNCLADSLDLLARHRRLQGAVDLVLGEGAQHGR